MTLEVTLQRLTKAIPDCLASGYLDMTSGHLLGLGAADPRISPSLEILGGAASDLLHTATVSMTGSPMTSVDGSRDDAADHLQEVVVYSGDLLHIFLRARRRPDRMACYVCRKGANVGLVLAKARLGVEVMAQAA